jgi:hypothetical protein
MELSDWFLFLYSDLVRRGAWSKAYENRKKANRFHSDIANDRVQRHRRIASTMFNEDVINMGRVLVLFALFYLFDLACCGFQSVNDAEF